MRAKMIYIVSLIDIIAMALALYGTVGALELDHTTIGQAVRNLVICLVLLLLGVVGIKMTWEEVKDL